MASHLKATLTLAAILAALTASPATAQRTTPATRPAVPTIEGRTAAVRAIALADASALAPSRQQAALARPMRQSEILMIIGGGLFLTGAIIGDDAGTVLMVGGVITGLYGLYQFLQQRPLAPSAAGSAR